MAFLNLDHDYLRTPHATLPSFHFRTGKPYDLLAQDSRTKSWGYPSPGEQSPTAESATAKHYFVNNSTWEAIKDHGDFDDIVVGSGFCALAYVKTALARDPKRKILILERGDFWLPEHFQNLPLPFKLLLGGSSETFPWQLSSKTWSSTVKFMHGSCPFFGGRSTFWSAWCPRAQCLMRDFPKSMLETAKSNGFWEECEDLLHVTKADKIKDPVFGGDLQRSIQETLNEAVKNNLIPTADSTDHAPLAVGRMTAIPDITVFDKFSTPGPLLEIQERQRHLAKSGKGSPLMIATNVTVEYFETDPHDKVHCPTILYTNRGELCFPKKRTNIILAAGTIPTTTILMNSLSDQLKDRAGSRLSGHFLTHITARIHLSMNLPSHLQIGASYLAGKDPESQLQYHIQITAIHSPNPEQDAVDAARLCPDYAAAATAEQLKDSEDYIVLVCAALGELDEQTQESWVKHNPKNPDSTTNIRLQVLPNKKAMDLWDIMDRATFDTIKAISGKETKVEYWHTGTGDNNSGSWKTTEPEPIEIRVPGVVHETSTLYMSDNLEADPHASVDSKYRPRGCHNVYVTGGALFPSSGSWNPTLTMCGFAQDLAKKLVEEAG